LFDFDLILIWLLHLTANVVLLYNISDVESSRPDEDDEVLGQLHINEKHHPNKFQEFQIITNNISYLLNIFD